MLTGGSGQGALCTLGCLNRFPDELKETMLSTEHRGTTVHSGEQKVQASIRLVL